MGIEGWKHVKRIAAAVGLLTAPMAEANAQEAAPIAPVTSVGAQNVSFYDEANAFQEPQAQVNGLNLEVPALSSSDIAETPELPITAPKAMAQGAHDDTPFEVHIPGTSEIPILQDIEVGGVTIGRKGRAGISWRHRR